MRNQSAWPTEAQELLIKAALFPASEAQSYWNEFLVRFDIHDLDHGCYQVLPMVFLNLKDTIEDGIEKRIARNAHKLVWAKNHLLMRELKQVLQHLRERGIDVCLLKGSAFLTHYFPDYGMRTLGDIDILTRPVDLEKLVSALEETGYDIGSQPMDSVRFLSLFHGKEFRNSRDTEIDVHQFISMPLAHEGFTGQLWERAEHVRVFDGAATAYVLSPEHQLLHTVVHGMQYAPESSIRWIIDAACLVRGQAGRIDWEELKRISKAYHLNLPLHLAIPYLGDDLGVPIEPEVIGYFNALKITRLDRQYYDQTSNSGFRRVKMRIARTVYRYRLFMMGRGSVWNPIKLLDFLALYSASPSRVGLLTYLFQETGKALRTIFSFKKT
ncbi:nucleotidyltransferase family protein [Alphaproteobacteria bacterium]|nr:nucleotidyltransferase family protein [Alphaproteobacteria bacterium]